MKAQDETVREYFIAHMYMKISAKHNLKGMNRDALGLFVEMHWQTCDLCRECMEGVMGNIPITFKRITALEMFREEYRIAKDFIEQGGGPVLHFLREAVQWKQYLQSISPEAAAAGNRYLLGRVAR